MKTFITLSFLLFLHAMHGQSFNHEILDGKNAHIIGKFNLEKLETAPYNEWFVKQYGEYSPNKEVVQSLKDDLSQYTIELFMGTWCGDSKREVPRFYKVLEAAEFSLDRLTSIAVDRDRSRYKQSPGGEHEGKNIHRVPTFIIYKDGKEINRIVERPIASLEQDLYAIINDTYEPKYEGVSYVDAQLTHLGLKKFLKKEKKILKVIQPKIQNFWELNTYSNVLMAAEKEQEALLASQLNVKLYPNESNSYIAVAKKLEALNESEEALIYYEKALKIEPTNEQVQHAIDKLKQNQ